MMEPATEARNIISFGPFNLFAAERLLKKGDEPILLGGRAIEVLIALAERAGEVATRGELISTVRPDVGRVSVLNFGSRDRRTVHARTEILRIQIGQI